MKASITNRVLSRRVALVVSCLVIGTALTLSLLWWVGGAAPVLGQAGTGVIRVALSGIDTYGCGSAEEPCQTIQFALDEAGAGDEIRVAVGTYSRIWDRGGLLQVAYFTQTVTVRGGYSTSDWEVSNPVSNPTILNAQRQGRVIVVTEGAAPILEGLRITGGDASGLGGMASGADAGGGVYVIQGSITISGCVVSGNVASDQDGGEAYGGGLAFRNASVMLVNTTVQSNTASMADFGVGGGVYADLSFVGLADTVVRSNVASTANYGRGGGLYLSGASSLLNLENSIIEKNIASTAAQGYGGGAYLQDGTVDMMGTTVQDNVASSALTGYGGGLHLVSMSAGTLLSGNVIVNNTASSVSAGYGGGLQVDFGNVVLASNTVQDNIASTTASGYGGGVYVNLAGVVVESNFIMSNTATMSSTRPGRGGGVFVDSAAALTMTNNILAANSANLVGGGGLWVEGDTSGYLRHTTIAENVSSDGNGQGVYVGNASELTCTNTILVGHAGMGITATAGSTLTMEATLWYGNGANVGGDGLISTDTDVSGDPAFMGAGDYHISGASAAVDAGVNAGVDIDIDGEMRPYRSGYDIGADEIPGNRPPVANAGADQFVHPGVMVTLHGYGSSDPDGDPLVYAWTQTDGDGVTLSDGAAANPTFTAPSTDGTLTFSLTVTDTGDLSSSDTVVISVTNRAPVADAGMPQSVSPGEVVTLNGSGSSDPDGDALTYGWTQSGGAQVALSNPTSAGPTFTAPGTPGELTFTLVVTDVLGVSSAPDTVVITVEVISIYLPLVVRSSN